MRENETLQNIYIFKILKYLTIENKPFCGGFVEFLTFYSSVSETNLCVNDLLIIFNIIMVCSSQSFLL